MAPAVYFVFPPAKYSLAFSKIFTVAPFSNASSLSVDEAYKILNLDRNNKITKEDVQKAYLKIKKKIHPDISPETSRLSSIVNEAKEVVLKDLS